MNEQKPDITEEAVEKNNQQAAAISEEDLEQLTGGVAIKRHSEEDKKLGFKTDEILPDVGLKALR